MPAFRRGEYNGVWIIRRFPRVQPGNRTVLVTVILFEDGQVDRLYPATLGRPAFAVGCGSYRLLDLAARLGQPLHAVVRSHLWDILEADHPGVILGQPLGEGRLLFVNGRLVPKVSTIRSLGQWLAEGRPGLVRYGQEVVAALLGSESPRPPKDADSLRLMRWLHELELPLAEIDLPLLHFPHDIIRHQAATLAENLADRLALDDYREIADGVFAAEGASLAQYVVTDTSGGPILLDRGATVGPYCYLSGPAYLGVGARVIEHSAIKDAVALGHTTKAGGEIECSVIEPYTNKQHHGFLGHSYVGSWVNLGAGTCNSDLKNTYGPVTMEYHGHKVSTEMQFVGSIIGDYAKTAINTSIFTGKTIGVCSMAYGFVTTNVPSFVNYARTFGQVTEAPVDVMIATQARMFKRRGVEQRPCDIQLLYDMYALTRHERQIADRPLYL